MVYALYNDRHPKSGIYLPGFRVLYGSSAGDSVDTRSWSWMQGFLGSRVVNKRYSLSTDEGFPLTPLDYIR